MLSTPKHRDKTVPAVLAALLLTTSLGAGVALATSVHLKGGPRAEPAHIDGGLVLSAAGELAGLGFGDVVINLSARANVASTCTNQGGSAAPGQNPAPTTVTGGVAIPASEIKNGNLPFTVVTTAPVTPIPGAPGCANSNWTESIDDLKFTSATITVFQANVLVLTVSCTLSPPTLDGPVPGGNVSCTSS